MAASEEDGEVYARGRPSFQRPERNRALCQRQRIQGEKMDVRTLSAVAVESSECDANVESGALQGGDAMVHHCVGECARVCARMCNRNHSFCQH